MRYEIWALERMTEGARCAVEPSMTCIPLREDPICRACHEGENHPFNSGGGSAPTPPAGSHASCTSLRGPK